MFSVVSSSFPENSWKTGGFVSREQETPSSYQQQSNQYGYASEDRPLISWKGSEGDAKYQKYYTTLPVHLQQTTGRMKRPRVEANTCTEKKDCKDHAADTCCWVPGSALPKECVKEVYTLTEHQSNLVYNPKLWLWIEKSCCRMFRNCLLMDRFR